MFRRRSVKLFLLSLLGLAIIFPGAAGAQNTPRSEGERATFAPRAVEKGVAPGQLIVKYKKNAGPQAQASIRREENLDKERDLDSINAEVVEVEGQSVEEAIKDLEAKPEVEYAQPDRLIHRFGYRDEPRFKELWGLHNTGQTVGGSAGVGNVDVNALQASRVNQGSEDVVVAVIDDGVDFSHSDLADRAWVNEDEIPDNNVDDDGNGYVDDVNGYDFANDDNTVHDPLEDGHGTHVSGTIAASVNGQGVVGVAPNVKIMAVKFLGGPFSTESAAIAAIEYAAENGAKISNNSWGYEGPPSRALKEAIEKSGMLFVAAAGNGGFDGVGDDNDKNLGFRAYPASFDSPNIVSVAALNNQGRLARFSNFGSKSVDIAAPGVSVLSTVPGVPAESGAALSSVGTSGKALVVGFGIEEISGAGNKAEFMKRSLASISNDPCSTEICLEDNEFVLVDDDLSSVYPPGVLPDTSKVLSEAIESVTGNKPEVIEAGPGDGPDLSQLQGKTVVWATGWAYDSYDPSSDEPPKKTLTFTDRSNLTRFLNDGGRLILSGMDALFLNEDSEFVTDTLGLEVSSDYPTRSFDGADGTEFGGISYSLADPRFSIPFFHDIIKPAGPEASSQGTISAPNNSVGYASGTSMASPHVAGTAALAASEFPGLLQRPIAIKRLLMETGKKAPYTRGKTVTGDIVNAEAAVTNTAPRIVPLSPKRETSDNTPRINARVIDLQQYVNKPDIQLYVDGRRKQDFAYNPKKGFLTYLSPRLQKGVHSVRVVAKDPRGLTKTKSWAFRIV